MAASRRFCPCPAATAAAVPSPLLPPPSSSTASRFKDYRCLPPRIHTLDARCNSAQCHYLTYEEDFYVFFLCRGWIIYAEWSVEVDRSTLYNLDMIPGAMRTVPWPTLLRRCLVSPYLNSTSVDHTSTVYHRSPFAVRCHAPLHV